MENTKQLALESLSTLLRNRYALLAIVVLGTVGPGVVKLSAMVTALRGH